MKQKTSKELMKFCGNCGNHAPYEYPDKIFCATLFCEGKNPIVETLWCCEHWNPSSQECHCIKEAMENKK